MMVSIPGQGIDSESFGDVHSYARKWRTLVNAPEVISDFVADCNLISWRLDNAPAIMPDLPGQKDNRRPNPLDRFDLGRKVGPKLNQHKERGVLFS